MKFQFHELDRWDGRLLKKANENNHKFPLRFRLLTWGYYSLFFDRLQSPVRDLQSNLHLVFPFVREIDAHRQKGILHISVALLHKSYQRQAKTFLNRKVL